MSAAWSYFLRFASFIHQSGVIGHRARQVYCSEIASSCVVTYNDLIALQFLAHTTNDPGI